MTLTKTSRAWGFAIFIISITAIVFFTGNQQLVYADVRSSAVRIQESRVLAPPTFVDGSSLASQIICKVFTKLNEAGDPIPFLDPGSACPRDPQCSDGIDNDGDGKIDSLDPSCHLDFDASNPDSYHPNIDAEDLEPNTFQCSDGVDNDGDGFTDINDPNCHTDGDPTNTSSFSPTIRSESGDLPACWNGLDDDGDGLIDLNDPGCSSATDIDESDDSGGGGGSANQCSDGIDNDGDGLIDLADPGCSSSSDNDETDPTTTPQCSDGIDNDGDGLIDLADPGCSSVGDNDENDSSVPQCSNGIDDDGDGDIDGNDPGCSGDDDNDESDAQDVRGGGGGGGSTSGGGGGGGSLSHGGVITGLITSAGAGVGGSIGTIIDQNTGAPISCDAYLTDFIKLGNQNNADQVVRLQRVLRDVEGQLSVKINGVYDEVTVAAVHRFQTKYADDILKPWGIDKSTGFVFLTTRKKVNEVYCRNTKSFPLTAEEKAKIEATRKAIGSGTSVLTGSKSTTTSTNLMNNSTQDVQENINLGDLGIGDDKDKQSAAAIEALLRAQESSTSTTDSVDTQESESILLKIFRVLKRGLSPST